MMANKWLTKNTVNNMRHDHEVKKMTGNAIAKKYWIAHKTVYKIIRYESFNGITCAGCRKTFYPESYIGNRKYCDDCKSNKKTGDVPWEEVLEIRRKYSSGVKMSVIAAEHRRKYNRISDICQNKRRKNPPRKKKDKYKYVTKVINCWSCGKHYRQSRANTLFCAECKDISNRITWRAAHARNRRKVNDTYVNKLLIKNNTLRVSDIPRSLTQAKKAHIILEREIGNHDEKR